MDFKNPLELWDPPSKAVPGKFHRSGRQSKCNYLLDRANFLKSQAWQNVLIFNTGLRCLKSIGNRNMTVLHKEIYIPVSIYFKYTNHILYSNDWHNHDIIQGNKSTYLCNVCSLYSISSWRKGPFVPINAWVNASQTLPMWISRCSGTLL